MTTQNLTICATVPCRLDFRYGLADLLEALCEDALRQDVHHVVTAFNEAFNNVVQHSTLGDGDVVELHAQRHGDSLEIRLVDEGVSFAPGGPEMPDEETDPLVLTERGMGLLLIRRCMDRVDYQRTDRNVLLMVKRLRPGEGQDSAGHASSLSQGHSSERS